MPPEEQQSQETIDDRSIPSVTQVEEVGGTVSQGRAKKESARQTIAIIYVCGFLMICGVSLLTFFRGKYTVDDTKDLLVTVSGILSGPLGFIIGYYFKAGEDK